MGKAQFLCYNCSTNFLKLKMNIMETNKNQDQSQQDNHQNPDQQKMQHRSDVVQDNEENGNDNPQEGDEWSNYRGRSLSSNSEKQQESNKK